MYEIPRDEELRIKYKDLLENESLRRINESKLYEPLSSKKELTEEEFRKNLQKNINSFVNKIEKVLSE